MPAVSTKIKSNPPPPDFPVACSKLTAPSSAVDVARWERRVASERM